MLTFNRAPRGAELSNFRRLAKGLATLALVPAVSASCNQDPLKTQASPSPPPFSSSSEQLAIVQPLKSEFVQRAIGIYHLGLDGTETITSEGYGSDKHTLVTLKDRMTDKRGRASYAITMLAIQPTAETATFVPDDSWIRSFEVVMRDAAGRVEGDVLITNTQPQNVDGHYIISRAVDGYDTNGGSLVSSANDQLLSSTLDWADRMIIAAQGRTLPIKNS